MKVYIVYINGEEAGLVMAKNHNEAENKAKKQVLAQYEAQPMDKVPTVMVAYTEV